MPCIIFDSEPLSIGLLISCLFLIFLNEANKCYDASGDGLNYYLNILWFLFKCASFTYNCTDLCFMCYYSVIMFYCFPMLNVFKFKVCIMLMLDTFYVFYGTCS
jgi:hypothetical protein